MPRTRRAPVSDSSSETSAPVEETQAAVPEITKMEAPRKRRPSPKKSLSTSEKEATAIVADTDAVPQSAPETGAPRSRRRRNATASETTQPEIPLQAASLIESSPVQTVEVSAKTRSRGRRSKSVETEAPIIEDVAVPETVVIAPAESMPPQRSQRGRRTNTAGSTEPLPVETIPLTTGIETEAPITAEATSEPIQVTPKRPRSRRRRTNEEASPESDAVDIEEAISLVEADLTENALATPTEEQSADRKRRRRGRRRRGGVEDPDEEITIAEGTLLFEAEMVGEEVAEEEEEDLLLPVASRPVYVAPPLVPLALAPSNESLLPAIQTSLRLPEGAGLPEILINGQAYPPYLFFVNAETARDGETVDSQIHYAAANGIHLFSGILHLPLQNVYGDRSFGAIDAFVQQVLHADPDAYLLPRVQFFPTNYWVRTHPDQMAHYADGSEGDVSVASAEFWADCVDALDALIAHFADPATPGGDRIIGFHLDRGEWFYDSSLGYDFSLPNQTAFQNWLHAKYQADYALRAAWWDGKVSFETAAVPSWPSPASEIKNGSSPIYSGAQERRWPDYAAYASSLVSQAITGLAEAIKTLSGGRLLVAVSYGYVLEFAARNDSGHLALKEVLDSPAIDIVAGPNSYSGRGAGSVAAFGAPIDSVALHGKLWLVEDDTKTFLAESETDDDYNPKITNGADTQAVHQRHFGAALSHKAGVTWMDLWGQGWLNSPEIWRELGHLRDQSQCWSRIAEKATSPEVAVIVDEASLAYFRNDPTGLANSLVMKSRDLLQRSGATVGFYLQSDVTRSDFPDAKLYVFLNALRVTTAERQAIRERLHKPGKTLMWLYAVGLYDENGPATEESGETVGMVLHLQPWNVRLGSQLTALRHPITERLRGSKRIGQEEILNPSYSVSDPQATVLAEYVSTGMPSLAVREHASGWKSVFLGEPHLTLELLRGLYAYAGVSIYEAQDDVVYASSDGVLTVHAPYTGQRTLTLPKTATVYDALEHRIVASETRTFRTFLRARTTHLFFWGEGASVAAATGLALPAVSDVVILEVPISLVAEEPAQAVEETKEIVISGLDLVLGDLNLIAPEGEETFAGSEESSESEETENGEAASTLPRSRWARRRAAARARREAERLTAAGEGLAAGGSAANAPVDISALLPDLPPRRKAMPNPAPETESDLESSPAPDVDLQ